MKMPTIRVTYLLGFLVVAGLLGTTFYLQKYDGVIPCPLCLLQRIDFALLGIVFFFGAVAAIKKFTQWLIGILAFIISFAGIFLSGRQVWLQHLPPDKNADCGVSLQYLIHVLPYDQALTKIMQGTTECSVKNWELLGFSMAEWSLLFFGVFFVLSIVQMWRRL